MPEYALHKTAQLRIMKEITEKHIEIDDIEIVEALGLKGLSTNWSMTRKGNSYSFRFKLVDCP